MNIWESVVLGIVQGLTEFLPVSSSGHLVIVENVLGLRFNDLTFEVVVHFGTLLSVLFVFWRDILHIVLGFFRGIFSRNVFRSFSYDSDFRLALFIIAGSVPAGLVGVFLNEPIEEIFHNINLVGVTLVITGLILFLTRLVYVGEKRVNFFRAVLIGIAQAIAILPGISRSGITISTGLFSGLSREEAVRFSFLLSLPAIFGANVIELSNVGVLDRGDGGNNIFVFLVGFLVAFVTGYIAIKVLIRMVKSGRFSWFSYYCLALGLLVLLFL